MTTDTSTEIPTLIELDEPDVVRKPGTWTREEARQWAIAREARKRRLRETAV